MKRIIFFAWWIMVKATTAQSGQFVEHVKLNDFRCTEGMASDLLQAAWAGKIQAYNWVSDKPVKMTAAEIINKLRIKTNEDYVLWDSAIVYLPGDRVEYEGNNWECLNDVAAGKHPTRESEDWQVINAPMYFQGSDIDEMRVQYAVSNGKRTYEWLHLIVSMNRSPSFWDEHIVTFRFPDVLQFLETTPRVFYIDQDKTLGWVTGDVYTWSDSYYQAGLIKALGDYAYRERTDCKIHISIDKLYNMLEERSDLLVDPFSDEQVLPFYKLSFRWKGNGLDSIRLYYDVDGSPIRVADIPHKPFQKSLKKSTAFKGFVDLTTALELNILTSTKRDTLALQGQTKPDFSPSKASKKSGDIFKLKQTIFCPLYSLGNGSILANDHVGSYILKAIHGPKVNQEFKIYQNDSLTSLVSRAELMERIIYQSASEFPRWDPDANYTTDDVIIYDGKKYQCLVDNMGAKVPPDSPDLWDLIGTQNSELQPTDFNAIKLHYWYQFDKKGQIILKALHAVTIYAYIDFMGIYKPIMAVPAETFRAILLDGGSGTQGLRIWNAVQQGKLGGYVGESSPIIQSK